jgi:hypothetical protein
VTILGTNADNDITVVGTDTNAFTVSVDGSPAVQYEGMVGLEVDGMAGDDDIDIDVNDLALTSLLVVGTDPSQDLDTLTVTGVAGGADNATWAPTPDKADEGQLEIGAQTIDITGIERVVYDGENEDETLTIEGTGAADRFTHTPGAARDAGSVTIDNTANTLLGIEYVNLGLGAAAVHIDGGAGSDTLAARGTGGSDVVVPAAATSSSSTSRQPARSMCILAAAWVRMCC